MTTITVQDLVIDDTRRTVVLAERPIVLPRLPFDFLVKIASDPERAWRREELLRDVWGFQSVSRVETRALTMCATRTRHALEDRFVFSVRGVGYRLVDLG